MVVVLLVVWWLSFGKCWPMVVDVGIVGLLLSTRLINISLVRREVTPQSNKRKRMNKFTGRVSMCLDACEVADACEIEEHMNEPEDFSSHDQHVRRSTGHSANNGSPENTKATSKVKKKGHRGKYKAYVVDMKVKGQKSKLAIEIPDEIDRAIGENARHLVNECGRLVRTRAPLNVRSWKDAFAIAGDSMWKEIEDKFEVRDGTTFLKTQAFVIDTMQRLYRLWKARLHSYYKSKECGATDDERLSNPPPDLPQDQWEHCVKRFGSAEFKKISERNSKNRLSEKRCKHTTGNLSFAEVEDILTKENNNIKPSADVIWLAEHTHKNKEGVLEWADHSQSKKIHEQLKEKVSTYGDSKTQEEILLEVLQPRSGYFRGKGTAIRPYTKDRLQQQKLVEEQQVKIQEQEARIHELEKSREQQQIAFEDYKEEQQRALEKQREEQQCALEQQREEQQREMEAFKQQLLQDLAALKNGPSLS